MIMKKIFNILMIAALALCAFTGCKEKDGPQHKIVGEWFFADEESGQDIEIHLAFNQDFTFDLYQKVGEGYPRYLNGTYAVNGSIVSGYYHDGTPWGSDYELSFLEGNMIMKSTSTDYSVTYKRQRIPDEVKNNYVDLTKSGTEDFIPFL